MLSAAGQGHGGGPRPRDGRLGVVGGWGTGTGQGWWDPAAAARRAAPRGLNPRIDGLKSPSNQTNAPVQQPEGTLARGSAHLPLCQRLKGMRRTGCALWLTPCAPCPHPCAPGGSRAVGRAPSCPGHVHKSSHTQSTPGAAAPGHRQLPTAPSTGLGASRDAQRRHLLLQLGRSDRHKGGACWHHRHHHGTNSDTNVCQHRVPAAWHE